jgi:hypothetical protein
MRAGKTSVKTLRAEDVSEFLDIVQRLRKRWGFDTRSGLKDPCGPWFRGHQKADWQLRPGLYRYNWTNPKKRRRIEDEIREEFITRAPALSEIKPGDADDWGWYFLMRHYGAPTRLLDWTDGALIALYFAVKENPGFFPGAVWVLDPYELNLRVLPNHKEEVMAPGAACTPEKDKRLVKPWLPERFTTNIILPSAPIAIFPTHIARRISSQRSCFTIHGDDEDGLEGFRGAAGCLEKVLIPSRRVGDIRRELESSGIDEATIFPDLDGLGRCIGAKWMPRRPSEPHSGVYTRLKPSQVDKHGVGVFAIKDIKKDAQIFVGDNEEFLWIDEGSFKGQPHAIRELYDAFAVIDKSEYLCPINFNRLTVSWYINEPRTGEQPNVRCEANEEQFEFYALRHIAAGEELTVVYKDYSDR